MNTVSKAVNHAMLNADDLTTNFCTILSLSTIFDTLDMTNCP